MTRVIAWIRRQSRRISPVLQGGPNGLARRFFFAIAGRFTPVMAVDRDGLRFYVSTSDRVLSRRLFIYNRTPERDIQYAFTALRHVCKLGTALEGALVVEIGANIGSHTVELLKGYGAGAINAIEPDPDNFALLQHNVLANGLRDRVTMLQLALSDRDGTAELALSADNCGDHRLQVPEGERSEDEPPRPTIEVPVARFDSLVDGGEIDLGSTGLIWMDVQGHEAHVLRGATSLLDSTIPVVLEYWPYGLRRVGALDDLHRIIATHYRYVVDLGAGEGSRPRVIPAGQISRLEGKYRWRDSPYYRELGTDLILAEDVAEQHRPVG